jgi:GTP-binding protein
LNIEVEFVKSAAGATDLPRDHLAELAMIGRSNVGKSSLINALVRRSVARTSAAPGKTRLANIYRVARGSSGPFYLVDLPGYGYARGGADDFARISEDYLRSRRNQAVLLLVDSRHPGLQSDREAWRWLKDTVETRALVATKIDKLARGERIRALRELQSVFDDPVLPVSAATGEGLDELWKLIDRLANTPNPKKPRNRSRLAETAPPVRRNGPRPKR